MKTDSYKIYTGGTIDGDEKNGLYTKINSYSGGEVITTSNVESGKFERQNGNISNMLLKALLVEMGTLTVFVSVIFISYNVKKKSNKVKIKM